MKKELTAFSIHRDSVILEYKDDWREVFAIINPFTFLTYLKDMGAISNVIKLKSDSCCIVQYCGNWYKWVQFANILSQRKMLNDSFMQEVLIQHLETQSLCELYFTECNSNFSFN